jgi:hypothetical protein
MLAVAFKSHVGGFPGVRAMIGHAADERDDLAPARASALSVRAPLKLLAVRDRRLLFSRHFRNNGRIARISLN